MFNFDKSIKEAKRYIEEGDVVQSSEKLYKCAEEVVKYLAEKFELPEYKEAQDNGKWDARLLFKSVTRLSNEISEEFGDWWRRGWFLHVEGFHEMRIEIEEVKRSLKDIENLVRTAKEYE